MAPLTRWAPDGSSAPWKYGDIVEYNPNTIGGATNERFVVMECLWDHADQDWAMQIVKTDIKNPERTPDYWEYSYEWVDATRLKQGGEGRWRLVAPPLEVPPLASPAEADEFLERVNADAGSQ